VHFGLPFFKIHINTPDPGYLGFVQAEMKHHPGAIHPTFGIKLFVAKIHAEKFIHHLNGKNYFELAVIFTLQLVKRSANFYIRCCFDLIRNALIFSSGTDIKNGI